VVLEVMVSSTVVIALESAVVIAQQRGDRRQHRGE
jgi:hypothetical protein